MGAEAAPGIRARARSRLRTRDLVLVILGLFPVIGLNVLVYFLPIDYGVFRDWAYLASFAACFVANAASVVPVPYIPVVAHLVQTAESVPLVVVAGAFGSVLGESVAFIAGRVGRRLVAGHPLYARLERVADRPFLAGLVLFAFAAPMNPLFDVAGLAAGALRFPYWVFFVAVFLARVTRLAVLAALVLGLLPVTLR
jgi:membrane protein YqaA with SNARE-associated domain